MGSSLSENKTFDPSLCHTTICLPLLSEVDCAMMGRLVTKKYRKKRVMYVTKGD
jgi:hypothetical protein